MPTSSQNGKSHIKRIVGALKHDRMLDIGCGEGTYAKLFPDADWTGIEVWEPYVEAYGLKSLYSKLIIADAREHVFEPEDRFDIAFAGDVLEHINNPTNYLAQIILHLKPNGYLFIQGPLESAPTLSNKLVEFKSLLLNGKVVNFPPYHVTLASVKTIERIINFSDVYLAKLVVRETWWPTSKKALFHPIQNISAWVIAVCKIFDLLISFIIPKYGTRFEVICQKMDIK